MEEKVKDRQTKSLISIYRSSLGLSMITLTIVCTLEILMLIYSVVNKALYGPFLWNYRMFYIALLSMAVIYIILFNYVRQDLEHRYTWLNVANPICAMFFFGWSLVLTFSDAVKIGTIDPTIFMTFSLTVPLSFYLFPAVYAGLVLAADFIMLYLTISITGTAASVINLVIFFIFQFVLGISFMQMKKRVADRLVEEEENARFDVMTGFPNRRVYETDMNHLKETKLDEDLVFIAVDINGLKEVNDTYGHDAGDRLIIGTSECLSNAFRNRGELYRIGGDEFAALIKAKENELADMFVQLEQQMKAWTKENGIEMTASYGYACHARHPEKSITELAKIADDRMYAAKARFYKDAGQDRRRRYMLGEQSGAAV
ncbi:MAG: diguanylate cyclase [Solobacterium sp.]|nr:diguanylate cyclase [Solobacterium sp.]